MREGLHRGLQISVTLIGMTALAACDGSSNTYVPPPPPAVRVAQPVQEPITLYFELTGNTAPLNSVDIEARVQGYLQSIDYQDGTTVTKGTKLFGIERDTYQAQLDQAKASLASQQASQVGAKQEYDRQVNLMKQQVTTQTAVDSAKATLDEANAQILNAQANVELATINLGYTEVIAPFDGTVTDHLVDIGTLVGVSGPTKLASIVQTDPIYAYFNVSETQVLLIKDMLRKQGRTFKQTDLPSIPAELGLQSEEGYPHKGHLDYVSPQLDASTGTLQVRALFDNKDKAMLPGLFVRVRVPIGQNEKALLVRDDAIATNQLGSYLLVLGKDDTIEQKQVKAGQREGALRVIESGLEPADWVVIQGIQQAIPGSKAAPEKIDMKPQPAAAGTDAKATTTTQ
ncbi:RND family efflux transporter MFP subunit [Rhizobium sp. BK275]|uniref:efflux RND transporter periplasmic adaptor subunit n=1 Tax=unclassified Rhizobium TaxID=2613769 RepID=UPI00160F55C0|nr:MULTISPECIES: efflux RND transporter periplasmic adaptor subunit [unclassified Rhizobium]MBB3392383.1 RND family efflux transporter MFP subunit [Rhizobium sp. BK275]MBB3411163.1 RND family efflux transporter MFP subunit [Rhizobium sp. BK316]